MLDIKLGRYTQVRSIREKDRGMAEGRELVPNSTCTTLNLQLPGGEDFDNKILPALRMARPNPL